LSFAVVLCVAIAEEHTSTVQIRCETSKGTLDIDLHPEWSPQGVERFLALVRDDFFSDIALFRSVEDFLVQFGISSSGDVNRKWATPIRDDVNLHVPFETGTLSFAGSGPNSRTTQLFFSYKNNPGLGSSSWETPLGRVTPETLPILNSFYKGYGDQSPWGSGPDQGRIHQEGNTYLRRDFPLLDFIHSCVEVCPPQSPLSLNPASC
jgi:cyclophilin family peptidyl-prolyl cis-trans isomerase